MLRGTTLICRLLILSTILIQSACKTSNENPTQISNQEGAKDEVGQRSVLSADSFAAQVADGNRLLFSSPPKQVLEDNADVSVEVEFKGNKTFSLDRASIALNGVRGEQETQFGINENAKWETREGNHVLVVRLSELRFDGIRFLAKLRKLNLQRGKLYIWVRAPYRISRARFHCGNPVPTPTPIVNPPSNELPSVTFDLKPKNPTQSRLAIFVFHSRKPILFYECALDGNRFRACLPIAVYFGLAQGAHRFEVRGITRQGDRGPITRYDWQIGSRAQNTVEITQSTPSESPTNSDSMRVQFRVVGGTQSSSTVCRIDGAAFQACTSPMTYSGLAEGSHTVDIKLSNDTSGQFADTYTWVVDKTAPQVMWLTTPQGQSNSPDAAFTFQASEAAKFICSLDGGNASSCETSHALTGLSDGPHLLEVVATDLAGNRSDTLQYNWVIDTVGPTVQLLGVNPPQSVTNLRTAVFTFIAEDAIAYECRVDDRDFVICNSPWQVSGLSEGRHRVEIRGFDATGNEGAILSYEWNVDLTSPILSLARAFPFVSPTQETRATLTFSMMEAESYSCRLDSGAEVSCSSPVELTELSEGAHTFFARAVDTAGNETLESVSWEVDHTRPTIRLVGVEPPEAVTSSQTIRLEFESSEPAQLTCELDEGGQVPCAFLLVFNNLADGHHSIVVRGFDPAGNVAIPLVYEWEIVTIAYAEIGAWQPSVALSSSRNASFAFSSMLGVAFECSLDGAAYQDCVSPKAYALLSDGTHEFRVRAFNQIHVAGPYDSKTWSVDATAPVITITSRDPNYSPTARTTMSVGFSVNEGSPSCALDGASPSACSSPYAMTGLSDGAHTLVISASDAAGNLGSTSVTWNVDSTPLTITSVAITSITSDSALITWHTNVPSTSQVLYGEGASTNQSTSLNPAFVTDHSVQLMGLRRFTFHSVKTKSVDRDGRESTSSTFTFRTAN